MAEIKCLYCSAFNKAGDEDCHVCGLPIAMSVPQEAVSAVESAPSAAQPSSQLPGSASTQPLSQAALSQADAPRAPRPTQKLPPAAELTEVMSKVQQRRAELAEEFQQRKPVRSSTSRALLIAGATIVVCLLAVLLQRHPEVGGRSAPDTVPVVIDESVGATPTETAAPIAPVAPNPNLTAAQKAIQDGRYDEADKLLKTISENDRDYIKALELRRSIESKLKKRSK